VKKPSSAKKKTSTPRVVPPALPLDEDGFLCLTGDRLWKWRAHDAELRTATLELESLKQRIAHEVSRHPELSALLGQQAGAMGAVSTARAELSAVQTEIEKEFGVSLAECAFDDKTGRLYHLKEDGERGEPMKTKAKRNKR
jgi:hypothetical protein